MHNQAKNIDQLLAEKANAYRADESFVAIDFEAIKGNLPTANPANPILKPQPTNWLLLNTILISVAIILIGSIIYFWNADLISNNKNTNVEISSKNSTENKTLISEIPLPDTSTKAENASIDFKLNLFPPKNFPKINRKNIDSVNLTNDKPLEHNSFSVQTQQFFSKLSNALQFFTIDSERDTFLYCENGTKLKVNANTFTTLNNGAVKGKVKLGIKEAFNYTNVVANGLHTMSNGNTLQTAGMLYLNAFQNNIALDINIKNPISVSIPTKERINGMQLFYLNKNANDNLFTSFANWISNGQEQILDDEKTYNFSIRNFGWMECGRFNNSNKINATVAITLPQAQEDSNFMKAFLVIPSIKSVVLVNYKNNRFIKSNLPNGEAAYLIIFKMSDDKVLSIIQKITIQDGLILSDTFKNIPITEVKAKLDAIGNFN